MVDQGVLNHSLVLLMMRLLVVWSVASSAAKQSFLVELHLKNPDRVMGFLIFFLHLVNLEAQFLKFGFLFLELCGFLVDLIHEVIYFLDFLVYSVLTNAIDKLEIFFIFLFQSLDLFISILFLN